MESNGCKMMNVLLWILGILILADLIYLSYFWIFNNAEYFPGRYEEAFQATVNAFLVGLPLFIALVTVLLKRLNRQGEQ